MTAAINRTREYCRVHRGTFEDAAAASVAVLALLMACAVMLTGCAVGNKIGGGPAGPGKDGVPTVTTDAADSPEITVRAEYPDGRPAPLKTLRVVDVREGAWSVATRQDGTAPLKTNRLPLVRFSFEAGGRLSPLPPARRHAGATGTLYVVTIPEGN